MKLLKYFSFAFLLLLAGCAQQAEMNYEKTSSRQNPDIVKAVATVMPVGDREISGSVTFEEAEGGVLVKGAFSGLEPGKHGFHIHEFGDCSAEDATSAGGHFSPEDNNHGDPTSAERHMGDLGNLVALGGEIATIEYVDSNIDLEKIIGRGIIIHAGEDDFSTQPSGASGERIACGVIGIALSD